MTQFPCMGEWYNLFKDLYILEDIEFRRSIKPGNAIGDQVLVLFSDGSESAFG